MLRLIPSRPWRQPRVVIAALSTVWLVAAALSYDFICDDAYIALRFARNLVLHGSPVYNLGERVEGYTSPLWVVSSAALLLVGAAPRVAVQVLGAASALIFVSGAAAVWSRFRPAHTPGAVLVAFGLALAAPVQAWALGGLETLLAAGLVMWGLALLSRAWRTRSVRAGGVAGAVWAAAALARPEAVLFLGSALAVIAVRGCGDLRRERAAWKPLLAALGISVAALAVHESWRIAYYGYPLPNTYYVKTSGDRAAAFEYGLRYLRFTLPQLGLPVLGLIVSLAPVGRCFASAGREALDLLWITRLVVITYLVYVASIGGDFLDLGRFLVVLLPLGLCVISALLAWAGERFGPRPTWLLALLLLGVHGITQFRVGRAALAIADEEKAKRGIEPLGWTRAYAVKWAATGRWLAAHSRPDDWMAVGAAGAMPFYAGIRNIDTFGLCDAFVAHHGIPTGVRPGHQRWAPTSYVLSKKPTFIFIGDVLSDGPVRIPRTSSWGADYTWVEARVDAERYGAPETFYHLLVARRDRVAEMLERGDIRVNARTTGVRPLPRQ